MVRFIIASTVFLVSMVASGQAWHPDAVEMLEITNKQRAKDTRNNPPQLILDEKLTELAENQANYLVKTNGRGYRSARYPRGNSHQGPNGGWPWDRAREIGYPGEANENVAYTLSASTFTAQTAHELFMSSSGHAGNLMNKKWTKCGFAKAGAKGAGGIHWVQFFGN